MDAKILKTIIDNNGKYLQGETGGKRANLRGADLEGADMRSANLKGANLSHSNLKGADLEGADLRRANLRCANLSRSNLTGADLEGADLRGADLIGANLTDADLSRADLNHASLRGADLTGANLDFSCWPLWCGSKSVKVDKKIAAQIAAHFCTLECDNPDYQMARKAILGFAKTSHHADDLGLLKIE